MNFLQAPLPALLLLCSLWGLLHSWLASQGFKAWVQRLAGEAAFNRFYRLSYNLFAATSLLPILLALWLAPGAPLYTFTPPWDILSGLGQGLAAAALLVGVMQTDPWAFIGLKQLSGEKENPNLVTTGLYAWVRHPLYSAGLIFLWLTPSMTVNRLAVWFIFSLYLFIGAWFEERKLQHHFGAAYAAYRAQTPMFLPRPPHK